MAPYLCIVTHVTSEHTLCSNRAILAAYAGFAAFGAFWGAWGASVPAVRAQAGLSDGDLGTALMFVGAGALPSMVLTGRAVDRWGHQVTALLLLALGGTGVAVALTGHDFVSLSVGMALLGATSGATDVAINAAAGTAERASGRPIITRAHGVFSAAVVLASLTTGALRGIGTAMTVPFALVAAVAALAGVLTWTSDRNTFSGPLPAAAALSSGPPRRRPVTELRLLRLLIVGGLGALAFGLENAHQSWGAVYLGDVLSAGPAVAAAGPAVFATVVAVTRFAVASRNSASASTVLISGAITAAVGTTAVAAAGSVPIALIGLGLAAAGTAVLYPTLLSFVAAQVSEASRGAATSAVATVAYLGFLAGPVYVGRWSAAVGLPGAMLAVAALGVGLALVSWPALRPMPGRGRGRGRQRTDAVSSSSRGGTLPPSRACCNHAAFGVPGA
jgi:MFS family permease